MVSGRVARCKYVITSSWHHWCVALHHHDITIFSSRVEYVDSLGRSRWCLREDLSHVMAVELDRQLRERESGGGKGERWVDTTASPLTCVLLATTASFWSSPWSLVRISSYVRDICIRQDHDFLKTYPQRSTFLCCIASYNTSAHLLISWFKNSCFTDQLTISFSHRTPGQCVQLVRLCLEEQLRAAEQSWQLHQQSSHVHQE